MSDQPGTCLWPIPGGVVRVSIDDAIALTNDAALYGASYLKRAEGDDPLLHERVPPPDVSGGAVLRPA